MTKLYRSIFITNGSIVQGTDSLFLAIPTDIGLVNALQVGSSMMVSPDRFFILSLSSESPIPPSVLEQLVSFDPHDQSKPFVFYTASFSLSEPSPLSSSQAVDNLHVTPDFGLRPDTQVYDAAASFAQAKFQQLFGTNLDFMERIDVPLFDPEQGSDEERPVLVATAIDATAVDSTTDSPASITAVDSF